MTGADMSDIQAVLSGDEDAYRNLITRHEAQISGMMWHFARNRTDCEQLVQDVFVEAYYSLRSYKGKAPFVFWLKKIAARTGYKYWKQKGRAASLCSLDDFDAEQSGDYERIEAEEASELLHAMLAQLSAADRLVLTLMYFEDCGVDEIAALTGSTATAVKMRLMRARKKLRVIAERENLAEKTGWIE